MSSKQIKPTSLINGAEKSQDDSWFQVTGKSSVAMLFFSWKGAEAEKDDTLKDQGPRVKRKHMKTHFTLWLSNSKQRSHSWLLYDRYDGSKNLSKEPSLLIPF